MVSIIGPSYNEKENITCFISSVFEVLRDNKIDGEVIIVDDNSPDRTGEIAAGMKKYYNNLKVLVRKNEVCLASAVLAGIRMAAGEILLVMDTDGSHDPASMPALISPIVHKSYDMVIGSRYISSGKIRGWTFRRRFLSRLGVLLAGMVTNIKDPTSGFFAFAKNVVEGIELAPRGQKICLEIIAKGKYKNIIEVPYEFRDRKLGKSKLTGCVIKDNILQTLSLIGAKNSIFRKAFFCGL